MYSSTLSSQARADDGFFFFLSFVISHLVILSAVPTSQNIRCKQYLTFTQLIKEQYMCIAKDMTGNKACVIAYSFPLVT